MKFGSIVPQENVHILNGVGFSLWCHSFKAAA